MSGRGWKVFEAPGVEPVFSEKDEAISHAQERARFRSGEIRILDSNGNIERALFRSTTQIEGCDAVIHVYDEDVIQNARARRLFQKSGEV